MINNLFIFYSSGKLLFSKNWKEEGSVVEDPVLISGFLSAIWMFAKKIGATGGIRSIQTENQLLVGIASPKFDLLFVLVADPGADIAACKHLLTRVRQSFLQKYRKNLSEDCLFSTEEFSDWIQNLETLKNDLDVSPVQSVMKKFLKNIVEETKEKPEK